MPATTSPTPLVRPSYSAFAASSVVARSPHRQQRTSIPGREQLPRASWRFTALRWAGIMNGTCNFILTTMKETGRDFDDVLAEAQDKVGPPLAPHRPPHTHTHTHGPLARTQPSYQNAARCGTAWTGSHRISWWWLTRVIAFPPRCRATPRPLRTST